MNITLDALLLIVFLYNFIIMQPFSWGAANREIYFSILFAISLGYTLINSIKARFMVLIILILLIYGGSTIIAIINRHRSVPWEFAHDSVFQNEIAGRMLLVGKNPYKEEYLGSGLENYKFVDEQINPAVYHFVTLPFLLLLNTFLQPIVGSVIGYFDGRIIYLLLLPVFLFFISRSIRAGNSRNLLLIIFFLNLMTARHFADGRTDFFVTALIFISLYFLHGKKYSLGGIVLGLALASKLTAWFLLPYLMIYLYYTNKHQIAKVVIPCIAVVVLLFTPFLIWDARAFFASTIGFFFGGAQNYPISGYGFSKIILSLGYIKNPYVNFPFWIFQIVFSAPVLYWQFIVRPRIVNLGDVLQRYAIFLLVFWFFSHHFQDNYFIYLTQIFALGYFLNKQELSIKKINKQ